MTPEQVLQIKVGDWFMPDGGKISSSIRVVEVQPVGFKVKRVHLSYDGEEFFVATKMMTDSKWVQVPLGSQLSFY